MSKARGQYYAIAHQMLPGLFFQDPEKFIETMQTNGAEFLHYLWKKAGEYSKSNDQNAIRQFAVAVTPVGDTQIGIITLPTPKFTTEAFFVATVYRPTSSETPQYIRYITLEYGEPLEGDPHTVLCEWQGDIHRNYGDGPKAQVELFLHTIITQFLE